MDARVDKREHPDGRTHIAHTSPHTEHSTSMMIRLKSGASLALGQDDHGVDDLVELAQVEEPTPEC